MKKRINSKWSRIELFSLITEKLMDGSDGLIDDWRASVMRIGQSNPLVINLMKHLTLIRTSEWAFEGEFYDYLHRMSFENIFCLLNI